MTFRVDPEILRACRPRLAELAGDTAQARSYADQHLSLTWSDSMAFQYIDDLARQVRDNLSGLLGQIEGALDNSGAELVAVANDYAGRDRDANADQDRLLAKLGDLPGGN